MCNEFNLQVIISASFFEWEDGLEEGSGLRRDGACLVVNIPALMPARGT